MAKYLFLVLLLLANGVLHAGAIEDAARTFLQNQAKTLGDNVTVTLEGPEVASPPCTDPDPFLPSDQRLLGRVTVGVRCGGGQVRYLQARVSAEGTFWVAAREIAPGTLVTSDLLEARQGDLTQLPREAVLDQAEALGRITTRNLAKGSVIQSAELHAPSLIHRNLTVTVEALGSGFRITREGEALQDGGIDDTVRIRMADHSVLTGVVAGKDLVKVSF